MGAGLRPEKGSEVQFQLYIVLCSTGFYFIGTFQMHCVLRRTSDSLMVFFGSFHTGFYSLRLMLDKSSLSRLFSCTSLRRSIPWLDPLFPSFLAVLHCTFLFSLPCKSHSSIRHVLYAMTRGNQTSKYSQLAWCSLLPLTGLWIVFSRGGWSVPSTCYQNTTFQSSSWNYMFWYKLPQLQ